MPYAIEADALQKTFTGKHEVRALDGVSFNVEEGRVFGLLGPNGSGKTTAVRVLTTILKADGGSARVLGHDVRKEAGLVRSLIGLAGQYAAVDENLTGRENLRMVGRLNHLDPSYVTSRSAELLGQFALDDAGDRPLKTYSGGMRRRLDLAAALVARPTVLFLDEPTTGLDPQSRNDLWEVIESLVGGGTTVLLTTQYLEEADRLATDLVVIDHGHVIAEGTPTELKASLGATVLEVGLETIDLAHRTAELFGSLGPHTPTVNGTVVEVTVDDGPTTAMAALRSLDGEGIAPTTFSLREPSLDDVFLAPDRTTSRGRDRGHRGHRHQPAPPLTSESRQSSHAHRQRGDRMTTAISAPSVTGAPPSDSVVTKLRWAVSDTLTITQRNLLALLRIPEQLFFSTVQPIMFVLLFTYVFGGAINVPGGDYVNYLMPGIFVQTVAFGAVSTSIGLAEDLQKGLIERFRALPMARSAVLTGRTTADMVRNVVVVVIITAVGLAVGFRPTTGVLAYMAAILLILLFAYALSWGFAVIGLSAPNSETAQVMSFPILFPLIFVSSAFVPVTSMPSWLQGFATYQPVSVTVSACRALMIGGPTAKWVIQTLAWTVGFLIVLIPLAVRRYRNRT